MSSIYSDRREGKDQTGEPDFSLRGQLWVVLGTQMTRRKVLEKSLLPGPRVRHSEGAAGDGDEGSRQSSRS